MHSELDVHKNFLLNKFSSDYRVETDLTPFILPELVHALLINIVPEEVWKGGMLSDVKGREQDDAHRDLGDELFSIRGKCYKPGEWEADVMHEFKVDCRTKFSTFEGDHHIVYTPEMIRHGVIPPWADLKALGRLFPLEITHFRMGLEFFRSGFFTNMLGFAPSVVEILLVEADQKKMVLEIHGDAHKTRSEPPLTRRGLFDKLNDVLSPILGFSLAQDYQERLQRT